MRPVMMPAESPGPGLLQIAWRHPWLVLWGLALCLLAAAAYLRLATPLYTSAAKVQVRQAGPRLITDPEPRPAADGDSNFLNTERVIMTSAPVLLAVLAVPDVQEMKFFANTDDNVAYLRKTLRVEVGKKDGIVSIELDAAKPAEGTTLVDAVVDAYIAYQSRLGQRTADDLLKILTDERDQCEQRIATQSDAIRELKRLASTNSFQPQDSAPLQVLQTLKQALISAHAETVTAESLYKDAAAAYATTPEHVKRMENLEKTGGFFIASDLEDSQLRWSIADLEVRLNELLWQHYLPKHPQIRSIQGRLDELRPAYVVATKRRWTAATQREAKISEAIESQQALVGDFAAKAAQYAKLETDLHRLERNADVLGARINEVRVAQSAGALKVVVVEPARADRKPCRPQPLRTMAAALVAGFVLGGLLAYARERMTPRLHTVQETKASLALPVLGLVPRMSLLCGAGCRGVPARRDPFSRSAEAYRTIHAAIDFVHSNAACRKLVITSPMSGDGRTTVASNLAAVLAQSGSRVLIIDADFRHPCLHRVFKVAAHRGLTSILQGQESPASAIQHTQIDGLDVLPCGPVPERPLQPHYGRRFHDLLNDLSDQYDHILLDTPAVTASSDARVIAAACDAVLLVVRIGKTDPRLAESACDGLLSLGARILGVVINAVPGAAARDVSYFEAAVAIPSSDRRALARAITRGNASNEAAGVSTPRD